VENRTVDKKWKENDVVSGAIVLLFDHHKGDVGVRMNEIQHQFYKEILSAQHFHLDHDNCLEIIAVKGNANRLTDLANQLIGLKGIIHWRPRPTATHRLR
jgi:CopG family nickel-responsive transcriptional regulator